MGHLFFKGNTLDSRSKHTKALKECYLLEQNTGSVDSERFIKSGWGFECYLSGVWPKQKWCGKTLTWTAWRGRAESQGMFYGSRAPATTASTALCCQRWSAQKRSSFSYNVSPLVGSRDEPGRRTRSKSSATTCGLGYKPNAGNNNRAAFMLFWKSNTE